MIIHTMCSGRQCQIEVSAKEYGIFLFLFFKIIFKR